MTPECTFQFADALESLAMQPGLELRVCQLLDQTTNVSLTTLGRTLNLDLSLDSSCAQSVKELEHSLT